MQEQREERSLVRADQAQTLPLFPPVPSQGNKNPYTSQNKLTKKTALISSAKRSSQDQVPIP